MDVAIADSIISRGEAFNFSRCPKIIHMINFARHLTTSYTTPSPEEIGGILLKKIYDNNFEKSVKMLRTDANVYWVSLFGDGDTIMTSPLVNVLGAGLYCQSVVFDKINCNGNCK